jgi:hypothetical protein
VQLSGTTHSDRMTANRQQAALWIQTAYLLDKFARLLIFFLLLRCFAYVLSALLHLSLHWKSALPSE